MPLHPGDRNRIKDCPESVPMAFLNEEQAYYNHGQTLKRLAERGGLSIREILSVVGKKPWRYYQHLTDEQALGELNAALQSWTAIGEEKKEVDNG